MLNRTVYNVVAMLASPLGRCLVHRLPYLFGEISMGNIQAGRRGTLHEHQANKPVHGREFPPGYLVSDRADKMREQLMAAYVKRIVTEFSPTSAELCKVVQKVCGK